MFKFIGIILAAVPVILLLRSVFFGKSKKTSQAMSDFKKHVDYVVWVILFFIGCGVVYAIGKLVYQFWT
jgi:NADH:ubiquinone oxidoreductase subunit 4 (subunit M)